jgi:hypothetical protein
MDGFFWHLPWAYCFVHMTAGESVADIVEAERAVEIPRIFLAVPKCKSFVDFWRQSQPKMPVRRPFKSSTLTPASESDPRTGTYSKEGKKTEYVPPPEPLPQHPRLALLQPTLERDLEYFFKIANGETLPDQTNVAPGFVLNLFRETDKLSNPVCERMILGQAKGAPYYALHSTPSATSIDEFNRLQLTRREAYTSNHHPSCVSEIEPKLQLDFEGTGAVARITKGEQKYTLLRTGNHSVGSGVRKNSISLWSDELPPKEMFQYAVEEGWRSLDDKQPSGIVKVTQWEASL